MDGGEGKAKVFEASQDSKKINGEVKVACVPNPATPRTGTGSQKRKFSVLYRKC